MNIQELSIALECYGCGDYFELALFKVPVTGKFFKPLGGLWTSPVGSEHSWRQWCEGESFGDLTTSFTVEYEGKTLVIDSPADLISIPREKERFPGDSFFFRIDVAKLLELKIDAIYLTEDGERNTRFSEPGLYGWDCETVYVMNPNSIKEKLAEEKP